MEFYLGPSYTAVASMIEQERNNRLTDTIFMGIMTFIVAIVSALVIYRVSRQVKARMLANKTLGQQRQRPTLDIF